MEVCVYRGTTMGFMHACVYPSVPVYAFVCPRGSVCISVCVPVWAWLWVWVQSLQKPEIENGDLLRSLGTNWPDSWPCPRLA